MNSLLTFLRFVRAKLNRFFYPRKSYLARRSLKPASRRYGFDRGKPVDRYFIELFMEKSQDMIRGRTLEIDNADYTKAYGGDRITKSDVLDVIPNPNANLLGDLRDLSQVIPDNTYDCVILTQTLNIIDDYEACLREARRILKPGGTLLMTMPTASPTTSNGNYEKNLWRFSVAGSRALFDRFFGPGSTRVMGLGNREVTEAFWMGFAIEDIDPLSLNETDESFPIIIGIQATKPGGEEEKNLDPTFSVGIPTYDAGVGLIKTVESVRASKNVSPFRLMVCVDGKRLDREVETKLRSLDVDILVSETRGGQRARIKQMLASTTADILILTQDDILFTPSTIREILDVFKVHPETTLVSANGLPLPAQTFFETIVHAGLKIVDTTARHWNQGDNYMQCGGKGLAFRTDFLKRMEITDQVMNSDSNFYFMNRKMGGHFRFARRAVYLLRSPQALREHLRQSRKSQAMSIEAKEHIGIDVQEEQPYPWGWVIYATLKSLVLRPIATLGYIVVFAYTRVFGQELYQVRKPFWETDTSTKRI